jgi:hypothetical protein
MNQPEPALPEAPAQTVQDKLLARLAGVLGEQKTRAQQGDLRSVQELMGESDRLLRDLGQAGTLTPRSAEQLAEIIKAHRQVEMILVAARQQAAQRLSRLRRGKGALRGYGG